MKPSSLALLLLLSSLSSLASEPKPNILFQGLKSKSHIESLFLESLEGHVRAALVNAKRVNIITRDSTYWKNLRKELELTDFIDQKTAVRLGEMSGASHYLDGLFVRLITETKTERLPDGVLKKTYNTVAELSLSLINLQSGKYESSFTLQKSIWSDTEEQSRTLCFAQLADDVRARMARLFPLRPVVVETNLERHEVNLDRGENAGMIAQSTFYLSSDKGVVVKITQPGSGGARAKLVSGDISKLKPGSTLEESFEGARNLVRIVSIKDDFVFLDGGDDLAIKKGDLFVLKKQELVSSNPLVYEESFPAAVVVTQVNTDFAKGRIAKGFNAVQNGIELIASDDKALLKKKFFSAGYKYGLTSNVKANGNSGVVTVTNNVGEFQIATDYNEGKESLSSVSIITLGFGTHNVAKRLSTTLNADIYEIGNGALKNWIGHLDIAHEKMLKENTLYIFYGGGIGYGRLKQKVPGNIIETISGGNSSDVRSSSIFATAKIGSRWMIGRVGLSLSGSYDFLQYKSWEYTANENDTQKIPSALLPYPQVNLSGLYVSAALSYYFQK